MHAPLTGINLVEASAGTGKTWNIEALTVRLMVERRMLPGDILVVTFTEAATQELRERIYKRLIEVIHVLKSDEYSGNDPFLLGCVQRYGVESPNSTDHLRHLENCKQHFDEAAISTIHGFCKTVLSEFSHLTRTDIELTIETEGRGALIDDAVDDFWRQYNAREATWAGGMLTSLLNGPLKRDGLRSGMNLMLRQDDIKMLYPAAPEGLEKADFRTCVQKLQDKIAEIRAIWSDERQNIQDLLGRTKISRAGLDKNFEGIEQQLFNFLDKPIEFSYTAATCHPRKFGAKFIEDGQLTAKNTFKSDHPVHELIDEALEIAAYIPDVEQRRALETIRDLYFERLARDGVTTFDALLSKVAEALRDDSVDNGGNGALHNALRHRYQAGLIDEFQDTDPVQFEIFKRIYLDDDSENRLLYLIGDPKQAIYKFRGADLRTYIEARKLVENQFTLEVNFRSSENMVEGVNAFFEGKYSFIDPELSFLPASAANRTNPFTSAIDAVEAGTGGNDHGLHFPKIGAGPFQNKSKSTRSVALWTASHIARSLESARTNSTEPTGFTDENGQFTPLKAGDIAVLVSSNHQARMIKSLLEEMGVPAVVGGDASIFSTDDARLMNLMLDVLVDPQRLTSIRTLLTSRLVGMDAAALKVLLNNDLEWSRKLEIFATARDNALEKGVLAGIRYLLDGLDVEKHLISWSDGERRITNLRHISELMYEEQRRGHRNLAGLAQWLRSRRNDPNLDASDTTQLRLESDENRVVIMTMHSSKGLQFPVVYAPFLWESRDKSSGLALYYSSKDSKFVMDFKNKCSDRLADARREDSERAVKGLQVQDAENTEDRVRLMYVAVTRSKYRCYVPHAMTVNKRSKGTDSPFTAMLLRDPAAGSIQWRDLSEFDRTTGVDTENVISELLSRLDSSRFCAYLGITDTDIRYQMETTSDKLAVRTLSDEAFRRMQQHVFVESYSSLKTKKEFTDSSDDNIPEEPVESVESESVRSSGNSIFSFPRGAHTGTFWHQIFENLDFSDDSAVEALVRETCEEYGFDFDEWGEVLVTMVRNVLEMNLDGFCMADVSLNRTLREMEFYLPYEARELEEYQKWVEGQVLSGGTFGEANIRIGVDDVSNVLGSEITASLNVAPGLNTTKGNDTRQNSDVVHGDEFAKNSSTIPITAPSSGVDATTTDFTNNHYLTGFIDLLVENNGKYYIIDYKSDYLGDAVADYNSILLNSHMRNNGYIMQYYFYTLALYLYLRDRIEDFDFDRDFGGVCYLFLRGMDGSGNGVFADKPDVNKIKEFAERIQSTVAGGAV